MLMPDVDLTTPVLTDLNGVDLTGQVLPDGTGGTSSTGMPDVDLTTPVLTDLNDVDLTGQVLPDGSVEPGGPGGPGGPGEPSEPVEPDEPSEPEHVYIDGDINWLDVLAVVVEADVVGGGRWDELGGVSVEFAFSPESPLGGFELMFGASWGRWIIEAGPIAHDPGDTYPPTLMTVQLPGVDIYEPPGSVTLKVSIVSRTQGTIEILREEGITGPAEFSKSLEGLIGTKPVGLAKIDAAIMRSGHPVGLNLPAYVPPPPPPPPRPSRPYTPPTPTPPSLGTSYSPGTFVPIEEFLGSSIGVGAGRAVYGQVCERNRLTGVLQCRQQIVGIIV